MTVGPDLDWLADPEANIRPEVARVLETQPNVILGPADAPGADARPAQEAVPPPQAEPEPLRRRPRPEPATRRVAQPVPPTEIRIPVPRLFVAPVPFGTVLVGAVLVAVLALYAGTHLGNPLVEHLAVPESIGEPPKQQTAASDAPGALTPGGAISGINVNLRAGPGLGYAVLTKLMDGQPVVVREARDGWVSITTNSGISGWVFGAYVSGAASSSHVPAVVRRLMVGGIGSSRVVLRPGDRVLHERSDDGRNIALLADGRRMVVGEGGLADVR